MRRLLLPEESKLQSSENPSITEIRDNGWIVKPVKNEEPPKTDAIDTDEIINHLARQAGFVKGKKLSDVTKSNITETLKTDFFDNNEDEFKKYFSLLCHSFDQTIGDLITKPIQESLGKGTIDGKPNTEGLYLWQLNQKSLISIADLKRDNNGNIYIDVVFTNLSIIRNADRKEKNQGLGSHIVKPIPGTLTQRFVLTDKGFKLTQMSASNALLEELVLSESVDLTDKKIKQAQQEEKKNFETALKKATSLKVDVDELKNIEKECIKLNPTQQKQIQPLFDSFYSLAAQYIEQPDITILIVMQLIISELINLNTKFQIKNLPMFVKKGSDLMTDLMPDLINPPVSNVDANFTEFEKAYLKLREMSKITKDSSLRRYLIGLLEQIDLIRDKNPRVNLAELTKVMILTEELIRYPYDSYLTEYQQLAKSIKKIDKSLSQFMLDIAHPFNSYERKNPYTQESRSVFVGAAIRFPRIHMQEGLITPHSTGWIEKSGVKFNVETTSWLLINGKTVPATKEEILTQALFHGDTKTYEANKNKLAHVDQATSFIKTILNNDGQGSDCKSTANLSRDEYGNLYLDVLLYDITQGETKSDGSVSARFLLTDKEPKLEWVRRSNPQIKINIFTTDQMQKISKETKKELKLTSQEIEKNTFNSVMNSVFTPIVLKQLASKIVKVYSDSTIVNDTNRADMNAAFTLARQLIVNPRDVLAAAALDEVISRESLKSATNFTAPIHQLLAYAECARSNRTVSPFATYLFQHESVREYLVKPKTPIDLKLPMPGHIQSLVDSLVDAHKENKTNEWDTFALSVACNDLFYKNEKGEVKIRQDVYAMLNHPNNLDEAIKQRGEETVKKELIAKYIKYFVLPSIMHSATIDEKIKNVLKDHVTKLASNVQNETTTINAEYINNNIKHFFQIITYPHPQAETLQKNMAKSFVDLLRTMSRKDLTSILEFTAKQLGDLNKFAEELCKNKQNRDVGLAILDFIDQVAIKKAFGNSNISLPNIAGSSSEKAKKREEAILLLHALENASKEKPASVKEDESQSLVGESQYVAVAGWDFDGPLRNAKLYTLEENADLNSPKASEISDFEMLKTVLEILDKNRILSVIASQRTTYSDKNADDEKQIQENEERTFSLSEQEGEVKEKTEEDNKEVKALENMKKGLNHFPENRKYLTIAHMETIGKNLKKKETGNKTGKDKSIILDQIKHITGCEHIDKKNIYLIDDQDKYKSVEDYDYSFIHAPRHSVEGSYEDRKHLADILLRMIPYEKLEDSINQYSPNPNIKKDLLSLVSRRRMELAAQQSIDERIRQARHGILRYEKLPRSIRNSHLSTLSFLFDSERGRMRAEAYGNLLKNANTPFQKKAIIYALLAEGGGPRLQQEVCTAMGYTSVEEARNELRQSLIIDLQQKLLKDGLNDGNKIIGETETQIKSLEDTVKQIAKLANKKNTEVEKYTESLRSLELFNPLPQPEKEHQTIINLTE